MTPAELTAAREALQLSQLELARILGVHPNVVNRWSLGKTKIPPYLHLTMAGIYHQRLSHAFQTLAPRVEVATGTSEAPLWIDVSDQMQSITISPPR